MSFQSMQHSETNTQQFTDKEIEEYTNTFALFDTNKDGMVLEEDIGIVMRSLGNKLSEEELKRLLAEKPENTQHEPGMVDFPEFLAMMAKKKEDEDEEERVLIKAFEKLDKHGNGILSTQELRNAMISLGEPLSEKEVDAMIKDGNADDGFVDYKAFVRKLCGR